MPEFKVNDGTNALALPLAVRSAGNTARSAPNLQVV
jgi:hypothetical protein